MFQCLDEMVYILFHETELDIDEVGTNLQHLILLRVGTSMHAFNGWYKNPYFDNLISGHT